MSAAPHRAPRIALFGPYSSRNLGDTATQMAVMQNLAQRLPNARFVGVSPEPEDTLRSLGTAAFPISGLGPTAGDIGLTHDIASAAHPDAHTRRGPLTVARLIQRIGRFLRTVDLLVISGGGQLDDFWGGAWGHPWSMLLWTALARWHGVPVVYLGVGVDHLNARLSQHFSVLALRLAQQRIFRDDDSRSQLIKLGLTPPSRVCPDLAFSLQTELQNTPTAPSVVSKPFVVLSPISLKTWSHSPSDTHASYLDALADAGAALAQRGYALCIACSQPVMDTTEAHALVQRLAARNVPEVQLCETPTVNDFLRQVHGAELVIASRLHGAILSLVAGCPVLALSHLDKVTAVMRAMGLEAYCLPLQTFSADDLTQQAMRALDQVTALRQHIAATHARWRAQLQSTFDDVLTLL